MKKLSLIAIVLYASACCDPETVNPASGSTSGSSSAMSSSSSSSVSSGTGGQEGVGGATASSSGSSSSSSSTGAGGADPGPDPDAGYCIPVTNPEDVGFFPESDLTAFCGVFLKSSMPYVCHPPGLPNHWLCYSLVTPNDNAPLGVQCCIPPAP